MKKKKIIIIVVIVLIIIGIFGIIFVKNNEEIIDDKKEYENNESESNATYIPSEHGESVILEETKEYKGLLISNIQMQKVSDRECEVRAVAENKTNKTIEMQNIKIKIYNNSGKLEDTIGAQIDSVEPGEMVEVSTTFRRRDISSIAKVEIEEN